MGIESTPTVLRLCRSGVNCRKIGIGLSPSDVVRSWLRLQIRLECIPHSCYMYTKCYRTLICCGWVYGSTLTVLHLCRSGVDCRKTGLGLSPSDVVRSWFRPQTRLECIPQSCYMYTKVYRTLIFCGWAYGSILTVLRLCRSGVICRKIGKWLSP